MTDLRRKREGALLLAVLNDLKRNDEVAAQELGVPLEELRSWLRGDAEMPRAAKERAAAIWPVNIRDLEVVEDDAPDGVRIMRAAESEASERILSRAGTPYYAYRDTAMSRTAAFRPEWIAELVSVDGADADDPAVQWNNGHLLHQFTYFIGPVNFYYVEDGQRRVAAMETGDTMYITPFVPHSFTTRRTPEGTRGLILALTFGGRLIGDAHQELSVLGERRARALRLGDAVGDQGTAELLRRRMRDALHAQDSLAAASGVPQDRLAALLSGARASPDELRSLAAALGVNVRDLLGHDASEPAVIIERRDAGEERGSSTATVRPLAGTSRMPDMRAFELTLPPGDGTHGLETDLHQYGYVLAGKVALTWDADGTERREVLAQDDSFTMKPGTPHRLMATDGPARLLLLRIGGALSGDARLELSAIDAGGIGRAVSESTQWYTPSGSRGVS